MADGGNDLPSGTSDCETTSSSSSSRIPGQSINTAQFAEGDHVNLRITGCRIILIAGNQNNVHESNNLYRKESDTNEVSNRVKKLESKNNEVVRHKRRVQELEAELYQLKQTLLPSRYRTRCISSDEKSTAGCVNAEKSTARSTQEKKKFFKAPRPDDPVISLHQNWAYFMATVVEFHPADLAYTVDWDDRDSSGRLQSFKDVAMDVVPSLSEIGVGSIVLFPQGRYSGGQRYHQGKITAIRQESDGTASFDGVHTKGRDDLKWITWPGYCQEFTGMKLDDLRIAPNAMDALLACKQAFKLDI